MNKIFSFLALSLFLLINAALFITCQRELSFEAVDLSGSSSGTAIYNFVSTGSSCSGAVVSGNYYTGVSLAAANSVLLQVNVTSAGTYNLHSASIDGFSFSASGVFTTTGIQTIVLNGTGTPGAAGNFDFSTPVNPACVFTVTVSIAPVAVGAYTLNGAPDICSSYTANGTYMAGSALTASNTVTISINVTALGIFTIKTDTLGGISFSRSGTFTNTGLQTVTLTGSGTPDLPGNHNFRVLPATTSCSFQISVETAPPYATYVLESGGGSPSPCIYTINGNYTHNSPLSGTNTVTIHVYVTVPGNFCIDTDVNNGMEFYYSGTFTSVGAQMVTLQGLGTPLAAGNYTLIPKIVGPHPIGGEACAFIIAVN